MNNVVIIGAGQTGRGFLNKFFYLNDQFVTFLDKDEDLINQLQEKKSYQISFGEEHAPLIVDNYEAYSIFSNQAKQIIRSADLIFVSVGRPNLKDVKEILKEIGNDPSKQVDIITAENGINVSSELEDLKGNDNIHIAESIVFCTTLSVEGSLDIFSEDLNYLPYDVVALGHTLNYQGMEPVQDLDVLMTRKILTYNCISACVAYLGSYKGYTDYAEAANDPEIYGNRR